VLSEVVLGLSWVVLRLLMLFLGLSLNLSRRHWHFHLSLSLSLDSVLSWVLLRLLMLALSTLCIFPFRMLHNFHWIQHTLRCNHTSLLHYFLARNKSCLDNHRR
jgi:hypothetical protein